MKKIISLVLCMCFVVAGLVACSSNRYDPEAEKKKNNIPKDPIELVTYEIPEEEKVFTVDIDYSNITESLKIVSYTGEEEELVIPDKLTHKDYGVLPVTSIGDAAFLGNTTIKNVTLPEGITSLGVGAFQACANLDNVNIPDTLVTIGENCFNNSGLKTINIPSSVTSIGKYAFSSYLNETPWYASLNGQREIVGDGILIKYNAKGDADFGEDVKSIAYYAFDNPEEIEITLGDAFKAIDRLAIFDIDGEKNVTFKIPSTNTAGIAALEESGYKYVVDEVTPPVTEEPEVTPPVTDEPEVTPPATEDLGDIYTIKWGDTLWDIANRYGTTWPEIAKANGIEDPDVIYAETTLDMSSIG